MEALLYWTGAAFWAAVGMVLLWFLSLIARDMFDSARFGVRLWRSFDAEKRTIRLAREIGWYCFKIGAGLAVRPDRMTNTETNRTTYWPGVSR